MLYVNLMVAHVNTFAFAGVNEIPIGVQVSISSGIPKFTIVGLPDKAVGESKERVWAAILAMGLAFPAKRITVNLSPADIHKAGSYFDLPIALGLLIAMGVIPQEEVDRYYVMGELSLDGSILPVAGVLPATIGAGALDKGIICPKENGAEARWAGDVSILAPDSLLSIVNHFKGSQILQYPEPNSDMEEMDYPDLCHVKGQEIAKRALEITAAGGHNMLMVGPPGAGKSMLASCLSGILPPLTVREMLEINIINSIAGLLSDGKLSSVRPFRDPHHSSSMPAMVGGGKRALPGEISLAHRGVLFLDELPEFSRVVLESLRQPIEKGYISVARANCHVQYDAKFQLVAAMNPCKCGYLGHPKKECSKAPRCSEDYQSRISGPLLDRFDIHVNVPSVDIIEIWSDDTVAESSETVAKRVAVARELQAERYKEMGILTNAELQGEALKEIAYPQGDGMDLLKHATEKMELSMRGVNRVVRVARTIADLGGSETVEKKHIAEALGYRK